MKKLLSWWPGLVAYVWFNVVYEIAGLLASYLVAGSMLAVCLLAIWEAGAKKDREDEEPLMPGRQRAPPPRDPNDTTPPPARPTR